MPRPLLIILKNGPIHAVSDHVECQVEALADRFDCELWAPGSIAVDSFRLPHQHIRIDPRPEPMSGLRQLAYVGRLAFRAARLRASRRRDVVVLAHDPLKSGLIGVLLSAIFNATLVVEINGVYAAVENYIDRMQGVTAQRRIQLLRAVAKFVLRRAHGARLLFGEQLAGFANLQARTARSVFFDLTPLERFSDQGEEPVILFVGSPFRAKGVDILISAFTRIADEFPSWRLRLIGHDLERHVREVTDHPRIEVLRAMPNMALAAYMNRAGIVVLPSRAEAMGRVLLEAAAAAKPRIAADAGGTHMVIENGVDGLLFPVGDTDMLTAHLRTLIRLPESRRRLGAAAQARALKDFSASAYATHMADLIARARRVKKGDDEGSLIARFRRRLSGC